MNRIIHLTLALGTVALLALLLILAVGAQPAAHAAGNTIYVPDDYATIQAAIDAAAEGDEIWVAEGTYEENLSISKGIALFGGWNITFTQQFPGDSIIDGQGLGRVISITCATSDTVVTVDGFTVMNGDATGLGMPMMAELPRLETLPYQSETPPAALASEPGSPSDLESELRVRLADLAAQGLYPGGMDAYQAMLERLEWRTAQAEGARASANSSMAPSQDQLGGPGAGGGIYSHNASLHLLNSAVEFNVASQDTAGVGGGIYVDQAPPSGVVIVDNFILGNLGCANGEGRGGGLYVTRAPAAIIAINTFESNVASNYGDGFGGGAYVTQSPGVIIEDNLFTENAGTDAGAFFQGGGGGLGMYSCPDAVVRHNQAERNTANAAWFSYGGAGGGVWLSVVDGAVVSDNLIRNNLAALDTGGLGGGLHLQLTYNALVADNQVTGNWAAMFMPLGSMGGGGISLIDVYSSTVSGNEVWENTAIVYGGMNSYGGGIFGDKLGDNTQIISNVISANVACYACNFGAGGGAYVGDSQDTVVADNTIVDNVASLMDVPGRGGGLLLRNTVSSQVLRNRIQGNRGGMVDGSSGGGLVWDSFFGYSALGTVDGNLILDNQASGDPAAESYSGGCEILLMWGGFSFTNNVVAGNQASNVGGVYVSTLFQGGTLVNNTIADNGDIGVLATAVTNTASISLTNNVVVSHTVGISVSEEATATVRYTLWHGNDTDIAGAGVISHTHPVTGAPAFADPAADDYHLTIGSAARDAGDPAGVPPAPDHDADGVARPQDPAVDLGAYEWRGYRLFLPFVSKSFTSRIGWVIGHDATGTAVIVHTADGGLTWNVQGDSAAWTGLGGNDISAVDDQTAWAALGSGAEETGGAILHTTDGGATWVSQTIPTGLAGGIKGIKGLSRDEAWAASLGGVILHTTDGGATWNVVPHPTMAITQVNRMDAMGTNVWVADSATGGAVVHTEDGGITWRAEYLPNDYPLTVHAFSPMAVWSSGVSGVIFYRTVNGGDQWDHVATVGGLDHLDDICAAGADDVWGVQNGDGVSGFIFRVHVAADGTPDAKNITPPELGGYMPGGVTCLDTRVAWVVATKGIPPDPTKPLGIILHTVDGEHWVQQSAPTHVNYWKVSFVGARR